MNTQNMSIKHHHGAGGSSMANIKNKSLIISLTLAMALYGSIAQAQTELGLRDVLDNAMAQNPVMAMSQAQQDAANAAVTTATAYINPEFEVAAGPTRSRSGSNEVSTKWDVGISQPLEFPGVRGARREMAESNVRAAGVSRTLTGIELRTRVKSAFYDVLQRQAVLRLVEGDRNLLQQIRERVKLRVDTGEAAKYELIKADTEALAAERDYQAALVRISEAKAYLRGLVGPGMPMEFDVKGELPLADTLPTLQQLRQKIDESPQLAQIRAIREAAEARLRLEEKLRNPGLTLKGGFEQDPDYSTVRLGVAIPLPVWNQRQGPIAEAAAGVRQVTAALSERELSLQRDVDSAYQRYLIAQGQVNSFESGLLNQAESALKVAESAYRFGERGILDYLDAQRTYRAVRKDYLAARYDYVNSMLEIERLLGTELLEVKS
ncbi:cyclic nucleotide-binding protein [Methylovorus sp. MP688]|jgi:cobalt-zinc-cadmium efflux system outer membrane protein|nr:cyclic nucleotide-binding protein [Methylovorus sp. MP688]